MNFLGISDSQMRPQNLHMILNIKFTISAKYPNLPKTKQDEEPDFTI